MKIIKKPHRKTKAYYIVKNAFKSVLRNKIQMVGLILLIVLTSTIFTLMYTTIQRVNNSYDKIVANSNLHDFVIDLRKTNKVANSDIKINNLDVTSYAQWAIGKAKQDLIEENGVISDFVSEYREGRMIFRNANGNETLFKVLAYDEDNTIDKLVISEGNNLTKENEIVLSPEFAKINNYKVGDFICLQSENCNINQQEDNLSNPLKIVGLGSSADYIFPQVDLTTPIPNQKREALAYVHPSQFGLLDYKGGAVKNIKWQYISSQEKITLTSAADREIYFVAKWKEQGSSRNNEFIKNLQQNLDKYFSHSQGPNTRFVHLVTDNSYDFAGRVNTINIILIAYRLTAVALLIIAVTISGFVIALITKKRVENSRNQIGILKSLGYTSFQISLGFLVYPLVSAVIGGTFGYVLGLLLQIPIINVFNAYFTMSFGTFNVDLISLVFSIIGIFTLLGLITIISSIWYVKGSPLKMLYPVHSKGVAVITKWFTYVNRGKSFHSRFRWAIISKSFAKMVTVTITMFLATILLTLSITGPKALNDMRNATYKGIKYQSLTEYETPVWNSPLSSYGVYNPDFIKLNKGVNSSFYSSTLMKQKTFSDPVNGEYTRYKASLAQLLRLANLNYALFDFEFYFSAILSQMDGEGQLELFKEAVCGVTIDDWFRLKPEQKSNYFVSECMIAGTTKKAPYFVRDRLDKLVIGIRKLEIALATKVLENKDLTKEEAEFTNGKGLLLAKNDELLTEIKNVSNDPDYKKGSMIARKVFKEIKERLNNVNDEQKTNWESNRYLNYVSEYLKEVANKIDLKKVFNIQFGLLTFNPNSDELATYFVPQVNKINNIENNKSLSMKAYGIERTSKFHELVDKNNNNLIEAMYINKQNETDVVPLIINQTVAKHLKINQGDILSVATNRPTLYSNNAKNQDKIVALDKWEMSADNAIFSDIKNSDISPDNLYVSQPDTPENPDQLSAMYNAIAKGTVYIKTDSNVVKMKVVGIQEGYGDPRMFLPKEDADIAMGYYEKGKAYEDSIHFEKMRELFAKHSGILPGSDDTNEKLKTYFNGLLYDDAVKSVFPLFNAKFSLNRNIQDITDNISLAQSYGDFTPVTLNGTTKIVEGNVTQPFVNFAQGAITFALPIAKHQSVFDEIKGIADAVLWAFMIISLLISITTILVTSNLIISENGRLIATMKVLGYNDYEINWLTLGMYLPLICFSFAIGFPIAWLIMGKLVNYLALNTTWVMPFYFSWGLLFGIFLTIFVIYIITFVVGWYILRRLNPIIALKMGE